MSDLIGIDFKFPDLGIRFRGREDEILLFVAAQMQTNRGEMFDSNNASRTPWPAPKLRKGQPLSKTGTLRNSFAPHNDGRNPVVGPDGIVRVLGDSITIGTKIAYADILNRGGVIRPKRFPVLWIPLPDGSARSANAPSDYTKGLKKAHQARKKLPGQIKKLDRLKERFRKTQDPDVLDEISDLTKKFKSTRGESSGPPIVKGKNGKYYLLAKQVTIPARPMDQWSSEDQEELEIALRNKLEDVLQEVING